MVNLIERDEGEKKKNLTYIVMICPSGERHLKYVDNFRINEVLIFKLIL